MPVAFASELRGRAARRRSTPLRARLRNHAADHRHGVIGDEDACRTGVSISRSISPPLALGSSPRPIASAIGPACLSTRLSFATQPGSVLVRRECPPGPSRGRRSTFGFGSMTWWMTPPLPYRAHRLEIPEPCSSIPVRLDEMRSQDRHRWSRSRRPRSCRRRCRRGR